MISEIMILKFIYFQFLDIKKRNEHPRIDLTLIN
jgi:hypothetical protein